MELIHKWDFVNGRPFTDEEKEEERKKVIQKLTQNIENTYAFIRRGSLLIIGFWEGNSRVDLFQAEGYIHYTYELSEEEIPLSMPAGEIEDKYPEHVMD